VAAVSSGTPPNLVPGVTSRPASADGGCGWRRMSSSPDMRACWRASVRQLSLVPRTPPLPLLSRRFSPSRASRRSAVSSRGHQLNAALRDAGVAVADASQAALAPVCRNGGGSRSSKPTAYDRGLHRSRRPSPAREPAVRVQHPESPAEVSLGLTALRGELMRVLLVNMPWSPIELPSLAPGAFYPRGDGEGPRRRAEPVRQSRLHGLGDSRSLHQGDYQ